MSLRAVAVAASLLIAAEALAADEIPAREEHELAVLLLTPEPYVGGLSSSELLLEVSAILRAHTNLAPVERNPTDALSECSGRLSCIALLACPEEERAAVKKGGRGGKGCAKYLVILSNRTEEGKPDRLSAVLVDTEATLEVWQEADLSKQDFERDVEARINTEAVKARPAWRELSSPDQTKAYLAHLFKDSFRATFDLGGNWEPYGQIEIDTPPEGLAIHLDGRIIGTTRGNVVRLIRVTAGTRKVLLEHPEWDPFEAQVEVRRGETARVEAKLRRLSSAFVRDAMFWSGIGVAAAGAAITAYGGSVLASRNEDSQLVCIALREPAEVCGSREFITFSPKGDNGDPNPSGVMIFPLGYSLMGLGGSMIIGGKVAPDDERAPWIALGVGVVVGLAAYGVSAALDGHSIFKPAQ